MKGLFKPKPKTPAELVRHARELLIFVESNTEARENKRAEKVIRISISLFGLFLFQLDYDFLFSWFDLILWGFILCEETKMGIHYILQLSDLSKSILEIRTVLFGNGESEPNPDACVQLTQEFFREDTFRLLVVALPKLELGVIKPETWNS